MNDWLELNDLIGRKGERNKATKSEWGHFCPLFYLMSKHLGGAGADRWESAFPREFQLSYAVDIGNDKSKNMEL